MKTNDRTIADRNRAHRNDKNHFSMSHSAESFQKTETLCSLCTTANGNSKKAIIVALIMDDHITTLADETAIALLGKGTGLLKLAARTFAPGLRLDINDHLYRISKIQRELLHGRGELKRSPNAFYVSPKEKFVRRIGIYLNAEQRAALMDGATKAGMSRAAYVRSLIKRKEITSRLPVNMVNEIRVAGTVLRAIITEEENRSDGVPSKDIINILVEYGFMLRRIDLALKREVSV